MTFSCMGRDDSRLKPMVILEKFDTKYEITGSNKLGIQYKLKNPAEKEQECRKTLRS